MSTLALVLLIAAAVSFLIAVFSPPVKPNLIALGLFLWVTSAIVSQLPL